MPSLELSSWNPFLIPNLVARTILSLKGLTPLPTIFSLIDILPDFVLPT